MYRIAMRFATVQPAVKAAARLVPALVTALIVQPALTVKRPVG